MRFLALTMGISRLGLFLLIKYYIINNNGIYGKYNKGAIKLKWSVYGGEFIKIKKS